MEEQKKTEETLSQAVLVLGQSNSKYAERLETDLERAHDMLVEKNDYIDKLQAEINQHAGLLKVQMTALENELQKIIIAEQVAKGVLQNSLSDLAEKALPLIDWASRNSSPEQVLLWTIQSLGSHQKYHKADQKELRQLRKQLRTFKQEVKDLTIMKDHLEKCQNENWEELSRLRRRVRQLIAELRDAGVDIPKPKKVKVSQ